MSNSTQQNLIRSFGRPALTATINYAIFSAFYGMETIFATTGDTQMSIGMLGALLGAGSTIVNDVFLQYIAPEIKSSVAVSFTSMAIQGATSFGTALFASKLMNNTIENSEAFRIGLMTFLSDSASERIWENFAPEDNIL
jgi:hypothetical protein